MHPYDDYPDDLDDFEEFAYEKSRSLQRLVNEARREERRRNRFRSSAKNRHDVDNWDWDDENDWDSYLDDSSFDCSGDLGRHY